ncbi:hypothetical protein AB0F81_25165 [Actinoplanes sp. NPDC024001]|uniref:hypothetical protein n=1 Tax=Actinoplanes sp. NPDC024001 TaxID=3154598 RepID=UPI0033F612E0
MTWSASRFQRTPLVRSPCTSQRSGLVVLAAGDREPQVAGRLRALGAVRVRPTGEI